MIEQIVLSRLFPKLPGLGTNLALRQGEAVKWREMNEPFIARQTPTQDSGRLHVRLACNAREIEAAQRLRYSVFCDEMGAHLPSASSGIDRDHYDPYCEHLIVRDEQSDEIVGTYRILPPHNVHKAGGYYSENEFDLSRLAPIRSQLVEVGRSCVHRDYRSGSVIALLWEGLVRYIREHGYGYLTGCASVSLRDGGQAAMHLYRRLAKNHLCPPEYLVFPHHPLPDMFPVSREAESVSPGKEKTVEIPPLLKGYIRAGAWICGEPAWDRDFNSADMFILLPLSRVSARYAKRFLVNND